MRSWPGDRSYSAKSTERLRQRLTGRPGASFLCDPLKVAGLPDLVEERLLRTIEAKNHEEALVRQRPQPVLAWPGGCRPEVDVGRTVGVLHGPVHRVDGRKGL